MMSHRHRTPPARDNEWVAVDEVENDRQMFYAPSTMPRHSTLQQQQHHTMSSSDADTPSYWVEHLATVAVGKQYGIEFAADGIHKLRSMEKSSAVWAQPMILRLRPHSITVEDENGELVEQFPIDLVHDPTAHLSTDPRDVYNNLLLFVVKEDTRTSSRTGTPTEMHIFQCNRISAQDVVNDIMSYVGGQFRNVRPGRRDTGFVVTAAALNGGQNPAPGEPTLNAYTRTESRQVKRGNLRDETSDDSIARGTRAGSDGGGANRIRRPRQHEYADDENSSIVSTENFEKEVNTLNRCFDDIERFTARIQEAGVAQKELEILQQSQRRSGGRRSRSQPNFEALNRAAQLPTELEFIEILQKFKLCFNILAKLKDHIYEPNAPELVHFLFTPLTIILDACQWGLGRHIAPGVVSPLLTYETRDMFRNCLSSKEASIWSSLGESWNTPPEEWNGPLPAPYRPVFSDGFMPYGRPVGGVPFATGIHPPHGMQMAGPPSSVGGRRSVDHLQSDMERATLSKERKELSRSQRQLADERTAIASERARLQEERRRWFEEQERMSVAGSERPMPTYYHQDIGPGLDAQRFKDNASTRSSPAPNMRQNMSPSTPNLSSAPAGLHVDSPRQQQFLQELRGRHAKIVQSNYDRVGTNHKELTVSRGEYLEVLNDTKNWWECRNVQNRVGFVPHTILTVISPGGPGAKASPRVNGHDESGESSLTDSPRAVPNGHAGQGGAGTPENPSSAAPPPPPPRHIEEHRGRGDTNTTIDDIQGQSQLTSARNSYQQHMIGEDEFRILNKSQTATSVEQNHQEALNYSIINESRKSRLEVHQRDRARRELEDSLLHMSKHEEETPVVIRGRMHDTDLTINELSDVREVGAWLEAKGFSIRTLQVLEGQDGAALFALTKRQLQEFVGRDEGQRLYSQLLVQKNVSGYASRTSAELHALLDARKVRAENHIPAPAPRPDPRGGQVVPLPPTFQPRVTSTLEPNMPPPSAVNVTPQSAMTPPSTSLNLPSSSRQPPRGLSPNSQAAWYRTVLNVSVNKDADIEVRQKK